MPMYVAYEGKEGSEFRRSMEDASLTALVTDILRRYDDITDVAITVSDGTTIVIKRKTSDGVTGPK